MSSSLPSSNTSLAYTTPSSQPFLSHTPLNTTLPPSHVLVKIHAAAINPVDIQLWGNPVIGWLAGKKEKGIGRDFSGVVAAVGEGSKWKVGDEVFGLCMRGTAEGTFTQYLTLTPSDPIALKPRSLSHAAASSLPLVVLTAFACLDWLPGYPVSSPASATSSTASRKNHIIIAGASGGVGIWVVQLAKKLLNCHVTGICSSRNAEFVRSLGADDVIDYTSQDVKSTLLGKRPDGGKGRFDLYVDCVGGTEVFGYWTELLHSSASYVTIVGDKTSRTSMGGPLTYFTYPSQVLRYLRGYVFGPRYANVLLYQQSGLLDKVAKLVEEDEVKVVVQDVVKGILSEETHKEAWEKIRAYMVEGRVRGKIVVDVE